MGTPRLVARLSIGLTGCALVAWPVAFAQSERSDPTKATLTRTTPSEPIGVTAQPIAELFVYPERDAPAQVVARNESRIAAETSGVVLDWSVDAGERVAKGQLIARLDPRDAELNLQRAQAALDAARARERLATSQLLRAQELVAKGFFSQEALTQRETETAVLRAEISAAQAQLDTARRQLEKTRILSPFDGVVRERMAQRGESVAPGTVLFLISERGANELSATINPADAPGLLAAKDLRLTALGQSYPVRVLRVGSAVSSSARTQSARLAFADPAQTPPAGLTGTLHWRDGRPHLPASLIIRRQSTLGVFTLDTMVGASDGVARFVPLPGAQEARAVLSSLPPGARVITVGQAGLKDGDRIRLKASQQAPAPGKPAR
jgi:RND family efflux transporter MFP subunit